MDEIKEKIARISEVIDQIRNEVKKHLVGQTKLCDGLLTALITKQHVLLEGVPGLAKTSSVKALSETVNLGFKRIQFTPDLLPADIVGTEIYLPKTGDFTVKKGPVFNNIILADEINRAPSKVQSALLEAMQEKQVTIGDQTYFLPSPFLVLATQNPIEQEGTYPLPEAQVDRFMLKLKIDYPGKEEEKLILEKMIFSKPEKINPVADASQIEEMSELVFKIYMDETLKNYIVDLVCASRNPGDYNLDIKEYIRFGASPRATMFLALAAKARALLDRRAYVIPNDIKDAAYDVLRHRILLSYEAEAEDIESETVIEEILNKISVP
ncbi:MAG: AAA family ATPase [Desulfobacteraceae bacterium]|nr:AAA family ATPase [Desulfobacteraceae bacterium]